MSIPQSADYRLSVFDKQGVKKDELAATFHCIWILNDIGTGYFTMATSDAKCTADNLAFGNYVLFEHAKLGNWGGVIAPHNQRRWNGTKQVTIPVLAAEYQFNRRRTGAGITLAGPAGSVFTALCQAANSQEDALIRTTASAIWGGGENSGINDTKNRMMSAIMKDVVQKSSIDWWLDPQQDTSGRLVFNAYLAQKRGSSNNYVLREGYNIETPDGDFYIEEGDLINDEMVVGGAATNAVAPKGVSLDQSSIDQYGLWQNSETVGGGQTGSAQSFADGKIATNSQPQKKFLLAALEDPTTSPNTFSNIRVGDIVTVDLYSVGFYAGSFGVTETARILSMEYSTEENKVILVTQVVNA